MNCPYLKIILFSYCLRKSCKCIIVIITQGNQVFPQTVTVTPRQVIGVRLGSLINPQDKQVEIYRLLKAVEVIQMPAILSGEDILPGFELQV